MQALFFAGLGLKQRILWISKANFVILIVLAVFCYTANTLLWIFPYKLARILTQYCDYASMVAAIILISVVLSKKLKKINAKPLVNLGKISFSVYLTHMVVLSFSSYLPYPLLKNDNLTALFAAIFIIPVAVLFYTWVEKPIIALANRIR